MQERQLEILRAIVDEYVATQEPVGSRVIAEKHSLGVSPATIRNEMALLEEQGLITQPHTSAGRIPTNSGYRVFVDKIAEVKPLSSAERRAIETFMGNADTLDDLLVRTAKMLAQLTNQVAVIQYPDEDKVILAGTANLARNNSQEPAGSIYPVLEALEEQVVLLRLLADATSEVQVRIGDEQGEKNLESTSLVTTQYAPPGSSSSHGGALGVLGPTRMNYASTMATVNAVARYIGRFIGGGNA
jgi:transcriptional regulator of heat shock response